MADSFYPEILHFEASAESSIDDSSHTETQPGTPCSLVNNIGSPGQSSDMNNQAHEDHPIEQFDEALSTNIESVTTGEEYHMGSVSSYHVDRINRWANDVEYPFVLCGFKEPASPPPEVPAFNTISPSSLCLEPDGRSALTSNPYWRSQQQDLPQQPLAQTSIIAFSDSGYASLKHRMGEPVSRAGQENDTQDISKTDQSVFKEADNLEYNAHDPEDNCEDTKTVYSNSSSATDSREKIYISEFAEDLSRCIPISTEVINDAVLKRLYSILPGLLKSFARKIGYMGDCQESRVIMVFVSRFRQTILAKLKDHILSQADGTDHDFGFKDLTLDPDPASKIQDWLQSAHTENDVEYPAEHFVGVPNESDEDSDEEADEFESPTDLPHYRDFVIKNPAYNWLLSRLEREMLLVPTAPNHMQAISETIIKSLSHGPFQKLSYKRGPHTCDMTFTVDWNPIAFLQEQEYEEKPEVAFEQVVTLTGSGADAQALTTAQYLSQTWPLVGDEMLGLLKRVIRYRSRSFPQMMRMSDNTRLTAYFHENQFCLQAVGPLHSVAEIGEIIAWLGAALRSSPKRRGVVYCSPLISELCVRARLADRTTVTSHIIFRFETEEVYEDDIFMQKDTGSCWHDLFQNPVVVKGYPTRHKPKENIGIEIPIEIMARLAGSNRISSFASNLFIKSFSTMLVVTRQIGDVLIWHLLCNEDGNHISYTDPQVRAIADLQKLAVNSTTLASARHVLGWCSNVRNLAGGPTADYNIRWSGLSNSPSKSSLEKFSISGGKFITASLSFALGKKDKPAYINRKDDYINQLKWVSKKSVVFYDVEDKRAWLVDGICALLHLIRASLQSDLDDDFTGFSCIKPGQLKEADQNLSGKAAAFSILCNLTNQNLKIHPKLDEIHNEKTTKEDGKSENVTKTKKAYYRLSDRVQQIYHILEQLITYQCQADSEDGFSFGMKPTTREHLEGFDFMDVATDDDPLWRRVTDLKARGRGWIDFTRAIHAPTLFGRGFGEILKPVGGSSCASWSEMPKGLDYLAVCCSDLNEIFKRHGDRSTNAWRIIDDIHWHCPGEDFGPCKCAHGSRSTCERVQVLIPNSFKNLWRRQMRSPRDFPSSGAVIFGSSRRLPLGWPAQGSPEERIPGDIDDEAPTPSHDSGLGSSLGSTPQTRSSDDSLSSAHPSSVIISSVSDGSSVNGNIPSTGNPTYTEDTHSGDDVLSREGSTSSGTPASSTELSAKSPTSTEYSRADLSASSMMPNRKRRMLEVVDRVLKKRK